MIEDKAQEFDRLLARARRESPHYNLVDTLDPALKKKVAEYRKTHPIKHALNKSNLTQNEENK